MKTPVALIIFNRPDLTRKVFEIIRAAKPSELFIISDGARQEKGNSEKELVNRTREITRQVDWKCTVHSKYSEENLGCKASVSSGLDWVFSKTENAIILEDDCLPDPSFFRFCEDLLERYANNNSIMMISGNNFFDKGLKYSYGFCRHSLIWGWAVWKRSWVHYKTAEEKGLNFLEDNFPTLSKIMSPVRLNAIIKTLEGKIDTWDYIWQMAMLMNDGYCIYPEVNTVRNIGFGKEATHTKRITFHSGLQANKLAFPLRHPLNIEPDAVFDRKIEKTYQPLFLLWDVLSGLILRKSK